MLKQELSELLLKRGFKSSAGPSPERVFYMQRGPGFDGLRAIFQQSGADYSIFVGKAHGAEFSSEEVAIIDECALWLSSRSDGIKRGFLSKSATTDSVRQVFYARIKKA
jgi:hypothetical protein